MEQIDTKIIRKKSEWVYDIFQDVIKCRSCGKIAPICGEIIAGLGEFESWESPYCPWCGSEMIKNN